MDWCEQRRLVFFLLPSAVKLVIVYIWSCHRRDAQVGNSGGTTDGLGATKKTKQSDSKSSKEIFDQEGRPFCFSLTN